MSGGIHKRLDRVEAAASRMGTDAARGLVRGPKPEPDWEELERDLYAMVVARARPQFDSTPASEVREFLRVLFQGHQETRRFLGREPLTDDELSEAVEGELGRILALTREEHEAALSRFWGDGWRPDWLDPAPGYRGAR
jgi:hypothetical protein